MAQEKNNLVTMSIEQIDNYRVKPESFPVKTAKAGGETEGKDKLAEDILGHPSRLGDNGDLTPSVWGKAGKAFTVGTSKGESEEGSPSKVANRFSVNFESGLIEPNTHDVRDREA